MDNNNFTGPGQPPLGGGQSPRNDSGSESHGNVFDEGAIHAAPVESNVPLEASQSVSQMPQETAPAPIQPQPESPKPPKKSNGRIYVGALAMVFVIVIVAYFSATGGFQQLTGDVTIPDDDDD